MILLTDNDIVYKLACCDLLDEAVAALGGTSDSVYVLPTARHVLLRPRGRGGLTRVADEVVRGRLVNFFDSVHELPAAPEAELVVPAGIPKIDPGEQALFAVTARYSEFRLLTGDKECLRALAEAGDGLAAVRARLAGRVVCFEQTFLVLIDRLGLEGVRRRVVPARAGDRGLERVILRNGIDTTEGHAVAGLESRVREVRLQAPDLLAP